MWGDVFGGEGEGCTWGGVYGPVGGVVCVGGAHGEVCGGGRGRVHMGRCVWGGGCGLVRVRVCGCGCVGVVHMWVGRRRLQHKGPYSYCHCCNQAGHSQEAVAGWAWVRL